MPNQSDPTQNPNPANPPVDQPVNESASPPVPPIIFPQSDLPPLPSVLSTVSEPDSTGQNAPKNDIPTTPPIIADAGSGAPPDISSVIPKAKKKFGGGKIIATILGLVVLVGGVGAGILLTQQPQLFQQKASSGTCTPKTNSGPSGITTCTEGMSKSACCLNIRVCDWNGDFGDKCDTTPEVDTGVDTGGDSGGNAACSGGIADGKIGCLDGATGLKCENGSFNQTRHFCPQGTKCVNGSDSEIVGKFCTSVGCDNKQCCFANSIFVENACGTTHKYKCSNSSCVQDDTNGTFTTNTCGGTCAGQDIGGAVDCVVSSNPCSSGGSYCRKWVCPQGDTNGDGKCQTGDTGASHTDYTDCSSVSCGNQCCQIDWLNSPGGCSCGVTNINGIDQSKNCKEINLNCSSTPPPTPTPTPTPGAPSCVQVKAYSDAWAVLTDAQLSALTTGTVVKFCVSGGPVFSAFDKAQFMVNNTILPETTVRRPLPEIQTFDYCQSYTILSTDTTVNVKAKIHHTTLGWVGETI